LYAIQTLDTVKKATDLHKALPDNRVDPLNVFIQVNTSGEDSKSGLSPLNASSSGSPSDSEIVSLARHILKNCPRLCLRGLMTIGSIERSMSSEKGPNQDFETLIGTADELESILNNEFGSDSMWGGPGGKLELSMGMSSDFEEAIVAGAGTVRVGTGIFGARKSKEDIKQ
jgi:hypothetical protein